MPHFLIRCRQINLAGLCLIQAQVQWADDLEARDLMVFQNNVDISDQFVMDGAVATADLNPAPGKKIITAQVTLNVPLGDFELPLPAAATSIYMATSSLAREQFLGGAMLFGCTEGLVLSPVQIPGMDLDGGLLDLVCQAVPVTSIAGIPAGSALTDPVVGHLFYGIFLYEVIFSADPDIVNGISISPIDIALDFDDTEEGSMCELSGVMKGTILPVSETLVAGQVHAAMVQTWSDVSVSVISGGECTPALDFPEDTEVIGFNYNGVPIM